MKKEYQKPTVKLIDFLAKETIADATEDEAIALYGIFDGEEGTSELPDGWE